MRFFHCWAVSRQVCAACDIGIVQERGSVCMWGIGSVCMWGIGSVCMWGIGSVCMWGMSTSYMCGASHVYVVHVIFRLERVILV